MSEKKIYMVDVQSGEDFEEFAADTNQVQDIFDLLAAKGITSVDYLRVRRVVWVDTGNGAEVPA